MMKIYYSRPSYKDGDEFQEEVEMTWKEEEQDIWEMLERLKTFLRAITYGESLVGRIQYLSDDQMAKLHLLGEGDDLQD